MHKINEEAKVETKAYHKDGFADGMSKGKKLPKIAQEFFEVM